MALKMGDRFLIEMQVTGIRGNPVYLKVVGSKPPFDYDEDNFDLGLGDFIMNEDQIQHYRKDK